MAFRIDHNVELIPQSSDVSCWSAALAMMLGCKMSLGPGFAKLGSENGLPQNSTTMRALADSYGLQVWEGKSWGIDELKERLERYGPLMIGGTFQGDRELVAHALVIGGMWGDGSPDGTQLRILNPAPTHVGSVLEPIYRVFYASGRVTTNYLLHVAQPIVHKNRR
jgi:hypothetical protein